MKKKKISPQHSSALIFIITLISSLIILGIVAYIILDIVVLKKVETGDIKIKESIYTPDIKDNNTILIIGENKGELEYTTLMFYDAYNSRIMFMPLPLNTFSQVNTKKSILSDFYGKGNQKGLCRAVENLFDISIQKYIELTPDSLYNIVKKSGNISFPLVCDMNYKNPKTNEVTKFSKNTKNIFSSSELRKILLYPYYPEGIHQNMYYSGVISSDILNSFTTNSEDVFDDLDTIYKDVISKSVTNIEEYDFYSQRLSFRYMLTQFESPAIYILPQGDINEDGYFIMDSDYKSTINEYISG